MLGIEIKYINELIRGEILKEYKDNIKISPVNQITKKTGAKVFSYDVDTFKFTYDIKDQENNPFDLSDVSNVYVTMFLGGTNIENNVKATFDADVVDKTNGKISFTMPKILLGFVGVVYCEIDILFNNGQSLTADRFNFDMEESLINSGIDKTQSVYVAQFEDLKKVLEQQVDELTKITEEIHTAGDFVSKEEYDSNSNELQKFLDEKFKSLEETNKLIISQFDTKAGHSDLIGVQNWLQKQIDEIKEKNVNLQEQITWNYNYMVNKDNELTNRIIALENK